MTQDTLDDILDLNERIDDRLRPMVKQLEFDGEISLATAQDISTYNLLFLFFSFFLLLRKIINAVFNTYFS